MNYNRIGNQTIIFKHQPKIISNYAIVGKKEGCGPFGEYFDYVLESDLFGEKTYEKAERKVLEHAIFNCVDKAKIDANEIDAIFSGDLLNQIVSSSFAARHFDKPFLGLYSACSTMTESLLLASCLVDAKFIRKAICATGSHFSTAEKQYRFPLELGNQRPPVAQWTVTGAGATLLSLDGDESCNKITMATIGKVVDYGITDANNMGAAMAPAAMNTLIAHFEDTKTKPSDYDLILTGDLGKLGSEILRDLMERNGYPLGQNYSDCGQMMYAEKQHTYQGGSGAGCSATIFNSFILGQMTKGVYKKVLFLATGALLSPTTTFQGDSIPAISHAIVIESGKKEKK
ncbi:MAG: stage V sporulation protein AD [Clostridiales bacterium]|nr:stage V sporulation protein AD [Candidatus Apopatousia equi]